MSTAASISGASIRLKPAKTSFASANGPSNTCVLPLRARIERAVLGTSNKSEIAVGYGTMYGDLIGALLPIGDLLKTEVFELAR